MPRSSINNIKVVLEGEDSVSWAGLLFPQGKAGAEDLPVQSPYTTSETYYQLLLGLWVKNKSYNL